MLPTGKGGQQVLAAESLHIHIMPRQRQGVPTASQVAGQQPLPPRHAKRWHHIWEIPLLFVPSLHCAATEAVFLHAVADGCLGFQRSKLLSTVRHDVDIPATIETPDRFS